MLSQDYFNSLILFINIFSCGVIFLAVIVIFLHGWEILSTRFFGLFWSVIFLFVFFYILKENFFYFKNLQISGALQFFIPAFYGLSLFVSKEEKFKIKFLLIFLIPVFSIVIDLLIEKEIPFLYAFYHLIFWSILLFIAFNIKKNETDDVKIRYKTGIYFIIITGVSVLPFIITNIIISIFYKQNLTIESMLPSSIAAASLLVLIFTYRSNLIKSDYKCYSNIDELKKSLVYEKKTIIEKITSSLIHEIKNPVAAIQSLNQQLITDFPGMKENEIKKYLEVIGEELVKIKYLSDSFLITYKKNNNFKKEIINIFELLKSLEILLKFDLQKKEIDYKIDNSIVNLKLKFNNYQLRQVFLNLIYNSIEADAKIIRFSGYESTDYFNILIEDNGLGINSFDNEKIFNSFYTTKNEGTGMGLAVCKEILNENLGNIELIKSKVGKTVFKISILRQQD